jgi:transglutaminase-like putative cysteine protease
MARTTTPDAGDVAAESVDAGLLAEIPPKLAPDYVVLSEGADQPSVVVKEQYPLTVKPGRISFLPDGELGLITPDEGLTRISRAGAVVSSDPSIKGAAIASNASSTWVLHADTKQLERLSPTRTTIAVEAQAPSAIAVGNEAVFVADAAQKKILRIDPQTGRTVGTLPIPAETVVDLSHDGTYLWAIDKTAKAVYMLDEAGRVLIMAPIESGATGVAVSGREVWTSSDDQVLRRYDFNVAQKYTLSSKRTATVAFSAAQGQSTFIALPWQTNRQNVVRPITLAPAAEVVQDTWGQYAAKFPHEGTVTAPVDLHDIRYHIVPELVGTFSDIPTAIATAYTVDGEWLKLSDPLIQQAAAEIRSALASDGRADNVFWAARYAYDYTIKKVTYQAGVPWGDAPTTIRRGVGTCTSITYVYMAVSRACGVPARYSGATRFRGQDPSTDYEFHRWAEIYLPGYGWTPADPSGTGKDPSPVKAAAFFGHVPNIDLVLTLGGGDSDIFGWGYNTAQGGGAAVWSGISVANP